MARPFRGPAADAPTRGPLGRAGADSTLGQSGSSRVTAMGRDIYAASAPVVVETCRRVLDDTPGTGGTFVAGQLFDAADVLAALAPAITIQRTDSH